MASDILIRHLARLPLFQGLTLLQLDEIARRGEHAVYHPGAIIIDESAEAHGAVLIVAGEAARVSGPELKAKVEPILSGSLLGEAAMLVETTYGSTIVARGHVRALLIRRDELHAQMAEDRTVADMIIANIARRLQGFFEELHRLDDVFARTAAAPQVPPPSALVTVPAGLTAPVH
jgi:CRP-like cAMP-binding protein